ncbi:unnamed protein product [Ceutorhynchus assimilis]|uniref:Fatty acid desaturase domain-containing protein n=1 Tax=Ceutorhynchus assimilis TaxID=467358 RepID=A0A9N9MUM7_9CUCU|nr:unnamed protein product [Ceutorhynchus assimilis]
MSPNPNEKNLELIQGTGTLDEADSVINRFPQSDLKPGYRRLEIVWKNVINTSISHCIAIYGFYLVFASASWKTTLLAILNLELGMFGTTAGSHRLWAHRAYKATFPLRLILMLCQTVAYQYSVINWVKEHRSHHKFQETDADPHNANRGFFFSHIGWLLCRKHPDVKNKGKTLDLSDLHADPVLRQVENRFVAYFTLGEGWHNYHHTFPWDYKAAELGKLNITLYLIDLFAKIGWAYDLKTASPEMIKNRAVKTGDGSHEIWGWGDKDQTKMPPNSSDTSICQRPNILTGVLDEKDVVDTDKIPKDTFKVKPREYIIVWRNVILYGLVHIFGLYGLYLSFTSAKLATTLFGFIVYQLGAFGTTGGAHRLWSHRAYKATWPLRFFLMICQTISVQNSVIQWVRDHRLHHKYLDTDADPHCPQRGIFFCHAGWIMCRKHPDVKTKGALLDLSDLYSDPILRFQHKHFNWFVVVVGLIIPSIIPLLWGETLWNGYYINAARLFLELNATWTVNSIAHFYGFKPYDKNVSSTETAFVSFIAIGEGWHNFHHAFPWDYRASEFRKLNLTLTFIDLFAKIGWAYDLKTVSNEMIRNRVKRTGDGSHHIWGWGDKDQSEDDYREAVILN